MYKHFTAIVAMDNNNLIGTSDNKIPWHIPEDLAFVKEITADSTLIMGRKNFESIGKALPNRRNIVLSRNHDFKAENCEVFNSVDEIINACVSDKAVFIFGGAEIYKLFLPMCNRLLITRVNGEFEGTVYFPEIDWSEWLEFGRLGEFNSENPLYKYSFCNYYRLRNSFSK